MDLNLSLDRVGSGADVDSMNRTFTEAILETRAAAAPLVYPNRFCLALSSQIKSIKAQKIADRIDWSSKHLTILFETSIEV
jgi:hypothetical protein